MLSDDSSFTVYCNGKRDVSVNRKVNIIRQMILIRWEENWIQRGSHDDISKLNEERSKSSF